MPATGDEIQRFRNEAETVALLADLLGLPPPTRLQLSPELQRRKTIDLLIGAWCIENARPLLHNDSDFRPMARYLGLIEVAVAA